MAGYNSTLGYAQEKKTTSLPVISAGAGVAGIPNTALVTTSGAHGLSVGDRVTLAVGTTSGWVGTYTVRTVPSSTTFTFQTGTVLLATAASTMPTITSISMVGVAKTPNRFLEFSSITMNGKPMRLYGTGMGAGRLVKRADRFVAYLDEATGDWQLECLTEGMGLLFLMALGAGVISGPGADGEYTSVFTPGKLAGLSMTVQVNKVDDLEGDYIETYVGVKVTKWKIENSKDGLLMLTFSLDALDLVVNVPLAPPSYSSTADLVSFVGGSLTMDGATFPNLVSMSAEGDNKLATKRRFLGSTRMAEQKDLGDREYKFSAEAEFHGSALVSKVRAVTPAGALANVSASWVGPTAIGGTTFPSVTVDIPNLVIEDGPVPVSGADLLKINLTGMGLDTDMTADDAITITIVSADSTF